MKTRLRNNLTLSLGDINGLRLRLNPASELVAYPPVDIKARPSSCGAAARARLTRRCHGSWATATRAATLLRRQRCVKLEMHLPGV